MNKRKNQQKVWLMLNPTERTPQTGGGKKRQAPQATMQKIRLGKKGYGERGETGTGISKKGGAPNLLIIV